MSTNALDLSTLDRAICGEIYASDAAVRNLERLCQECSGRFAGSDDYRRAAEMVAEWWREIGLSQRAPGAVPLHGLGTWQRQPDADRAGNAAATRVWPSPTRRPATWKPRSSTWASGWTPM